MDEVRRSWFTGVGNTQGSKAFDITVNCRVSANNQFNTVSLTMDATPDPSNAPGYSSLPPAAPRMPPASASRY